MAWPELSPFAFLATGHLIESESEPAARRPASGARVAWWLVGLLTASTGYFAVQFTGQVRDDVRDLQASRRAHELTDASAQTEREAIRQALGRLTEAVTKLDDRLERLQERENGNGRRGGI